MLVHSCCFLVRRDRSFFFNSQTNHLTFWNLVAFDVCVPPWTTANTRPSYQNRIMNSKSVVLWTRKLSFVPLHHSLPNASPLASFFWMGSFPDKTPPFRQRGHGSLKTLIASSLSFFDTTMKGNSTITILEHPWSTHRLLASQWLHSPGGLPVCFLLSVRQMDCASVQFHDLFFPSLLILCLLGTKRQGMTSEVHMLCGLWWIPPHFLPFPQQPRHEHRLMTSRRFVVVSAPYLFKSKLTRLVATPFWSKNM